jgi:hypothetical protein
MVSGMTCVFAPSTVTPPAYGSVATTFSVDIPAGQRPGTYTFFAAAKTSGSDMPPLPINVTVLAPSFTVSCNAPAPVPQGTNATGTCTVSSINGFDETVQMSCNPDNVNVHCTLDPTSITVPRNGSAAATLSVDTSNMSPGTYRIYVTGGSSRYGTTSTGVDVIVGS